MLSLEVSRPHWWCSLEDWSTHVAPVLAKDHNKRATGGWHVTHAIEVERR